MELGNSVGGGREDPEALVGAFGLDGKAKGLERLSVDSWRRTRDGGIPQGGRRIPCSGCEIEFLGSGLPR